MSDSAAPARLSPATNGIHRSGGHVTPLRPPLPPVTPAPSTPIATAVRRFGDALPEPTGTRLLRSLGAAALAAMVVYLLWVATHLNLSMWFLAVPILAANVFSALTLIFSVVNNWTREIPSARPVDPGDEPLVGVIIPTCGEPPAMVLRTVISVLDQNYPTDRLCVAVSDDAHNPEILRALDGLPVLYFQPPPRDAPPRNGAAKAGNLNCALEFLLARHPDLQFVETRDCDDEVGSDDFLRHVTGQLLADDGLAFVQTIKETQVSAGDPFCNRDTSFYRGQMLARNATGSAFPCGSGLLWRVSALQDIGGFPVWNLVEDLQSGIEALKRGWRGMYLPIVGAVGQHSPEDLPSYNKQRGTWAMDTCRLLFWGRMRGLSPRQILQFSDTALFYLHAWTVPVYVITAAAAFCGALPVDGDPWQYLAVLAPYSLLIEARLLALNHPYNDRRARQRHVLRVMLRQRIMWTGMAPVYMRASLLALLYGPTRKPVYKVTRKTDDHRWHYTGVIAHAAMIIGLIAAAAVGILWHLAPAWPTLVMCAYWGMVNCVLLGGFITRSWYGTQLIRLTRRDTRRSGKTIMVDDPVALPVASDHRGPARRHAHADTNAA